MLPSRASLHRPEIYDLLTEGDRILTRAMLGHRHAFSAGQAMCDLGRSADFVWRLRTGWVSSVRHLSDGRSQIMSFALPPNLLGVRSVIFPTAVDQLECLTDVVALRIGQRELRELAQQHEAVAVRLMAQIADDQRRLQDWATALGRGSAPERVAIVLLDVRARLSHLGLSRSGSFRLPMTQEQLADYVGLTVVHLNRVLSRLRGEDVAHVRRGVVMISDPQALVRLAGSLLEPHLAGGHVQDSADPELL